MIAGGVAPFIDAHFFVSSQLPTEAPHALLSTERVLALQMGNLYLLACMIGLAVLYTTTEARVAHAYLFALWVADIGHVGVTAWAMGWDEFVNVKEYNAMAWGNVGATTFLFVVRTAYFLGLLGRDKVLTGGKKKAK